uniref:ORF45b n=1 Tax=Pinus koraiensis TaxID=88728 RepID=A4QMK6_PINKO|nr:ORF45b [Pinus koraiensis]ABP35373.1 ORF45b [Pinus koraiensis]
MINERKVMNRVQVYIYRLSGHNVEVFSVLVMENLVLVIEKSKTCS